MKKLITLNNPQADLMQTLMEETYQTSPSQLLVFLMVNYLQNKKGTVGRPRSQSNGTDEGDSMVAKYQAPDYPLTKSPYTKDEVDGWYEFRGMSIPRDAYKLHPKYKGEG